MLSARQFVYSQVCSYPSLYHSDGYDSSALKVLDHFFNVIGNGIELPDSVLDVHVDTKFAEKFMRGEKVYWGYEETERLKHGAIIPKRSSKEVICCESEKYLHANIKLWIECEAYDWAPYPNFEEEYSTVYEDGFKVLGKDWIDAAIWFYQKCVEFFDKTPEMYSYAYPCKSERETENRLFDMKQRLFSYKTNEEVSEAYECEFDGDIDKFLRLRWNKELARIQQFLSDTIKHLENMKNETSA